MQTTDYPTLYKECGDNAAINQKRHFRLLIATITLLILVSILGNIKWKMIAVDYALMPLEFSIIPPVTIAVFLVILFFFNKKSQNKSLEKNWYTSRAYAESIKQATWLYIMKAEPYNTENAKENFKGFLNALKTSGELPESVVSKNAIEITENMEKQRNANLKDKTQFYLQFRLQDQHNWYERKAYTFAKKEKWLMALMWSLALVAILIAFVNAYVGFVSIELPINFVSIASTLGASILSWVGAKRYKELSESYKAVASDLSEKDILKASTAEELSSAVSDVEQLMSQERTYWQIKRLSKSLKDP
jgi:hypothetical protein